MAYDQQAKYIGIKCKLNSPSHSISETINIQAQLRLQPEPRPCTCPHIG